MGDMGDYWRDVKPALREASRRKRQQNFIRGPEYLRLHGIGYTSHNEGQHLVVTVGDMRIDYWPSTGLWKVRGQDLSRRGVGTLTQYVKAKRRKQEKQP